MADGIIVTKADGENLKAAKQAQADALQAVHFQAPPASGWKTRVLTSSSLEKKGLNDVWKMIQSYQQHASSTGYLIENRRSQQRQWLDESVENCFRELLQESWVVKKKEQLLKKVLKNTLLPSEAAEALWGEVLARKRK